MLYGLGAMVTVAVVMVFVWTETRPVYAQYVARMRVFLLVAVVVWPLFWCLFVLEAWHGWRLR